MRAAFAVIMSLALLIIPRAVAAPFAETADLSGTWLLNYELSDDPRGNPVAVGDDGRRGRGGGFGGRIGRPGGGRTGRGGYGRAGDGIDPEKLRKRMTGVREAFADLLTAPRRMTIVQRESESVLTYDDGRLVRLIPDGREHAGIAGQGIKIIRKTSWDAGALRAEIRIESGPKLIHVLEPRLHGEQLVATTTVEPHGDNAGLELRRIYDRG